MMLDSFFWCILDILSDNNICRLKFIILFRIYYLYTFWWTNFSIEFLKGITIKSCIFYLVITNVWYFICIHFLIRDGHRLHPRYIVYIWYNIAYKVFDFEWDNENKWDKYITWTGGKYLLPYKYIHRIDEFKSSGVTKYSHSKNISVLHLYIICKL